MSPELKTENSLYMTLQLITVRKAEQGELELSWHTQKSLKNNQLNSNHHTSRTFRARKDLGDLLLFFLHFSAKENKARQEIQRPPRHAG